MASTEETLAALDQAVRAQPGDTDIRIQRNRLRLRAGQIGHWNHTPLHQDQLEALHDIAEQYAQTPEQTIQRIEIQDLYVTELKLRNKHGKPIKLKLPQQLIKLQTLYCYNNQLTTLTIPPNTPLTILDCFNNQLTTLTIPPNTPLTILDCFNNQLTTLTIPPNTPLTRLECSDNQLRTLTIPPNTPLTRLDCVDNQLKTLTIPPNTPLNILDCVDNQLTSLNVPPNTPLKRLFCYNNQLTTLTIPKHQFTFRTDPGVEIIRH